MKNSWKLSIDKNGYVLYYNGRVIKSNSLEYLLSFIR